MQMIYRCDLCGLEFSDWGKCYEHEMRHIRPTRIETAENYLQPEDEDYKHPYARYITVKMSDGAIVGYHYCGIVQEPQEEIA